MKFSEHPDYVKYRTIPNYLYAKIALEQCGKCGCGCGRDLEFEQRKIRIEHIMQRAFGGKHEEGNIALWCVKPCALAKDRRDAANRKKVRSLTKSTKKSQRPKKKIQGRTKIQSRGFNDSFKPNIKEID